MIADALPESLLETLDLRSNVANLIKICNPKRCSNGVWVTSRIVCFEDFGIQCPDGAHFEPAAPGQCCSTCVEDIETTGIV